jgi:hypothetical protein
VPTLYVESAKIELNLEQLVRAVEALSPTERQIIRRALDQNWTERLEELLTRVYARFQAEPMDEEELDSEIEAARDAYHAHRSR